MTEAQEELKLTPEEVEAIVQETYSDPVEFCKFFLEHLFPDEIPWVHRGLLAILTGRVDFLWKYGEVDKIERNFVWQDQHEVEHKVFEVDHENEKIKMFLGKFTLVMMPRGSGKTTIAGIMMPLYEILFKEVPFTVYVSEAAPHAKMQLHNVQRELIDNRRIRAVFGDLKPALRDDERWTGDFFETNTGVAMIARGRGGQVRGLLHRGHRPKKIIVDDVEDKESVATDGQRDKTKEWAYGDLMPALPRLIADATITALGTLLHRDSLLVTWQKDPRWTVIKFGVFDLDGDPIWPRFMTAAGFEEEKTSYAVAGELHIFYMEYLNEYTSPETQVFKQEFFKYNPEVEDITHSVIYIDPAISHKRKANKSAISVVGITDKGMIRVLESVAKRGMDEEEKIDIYFELHIRWKCTQAGIESQSYQAALVHTMREQMFRRGHYFEILPVTHKTQKNSRIKGILRPRFGSGYIEFRLRWPSLETELLDFRPDIDDQQDDEIDALAGAVALLDPYAAQAAGDVDLSKDEYPPLEEVMGGDWRTH